MTHPLKPSLVRRWLALAAVALASLIPCLEAGTVRTLDGKLWEGELRFNDAGALVIKPAEGDTVTIAWEEIARATFASGSFVSSGSILPNGWTAQDLGETRGFARLDTNTFVLRVEGLSTNATACHFVSRPMPSDADMMVRVEEITGTGTANAGVMIRGENSSSAFAALSLGHDGRLWFHRRAESDRKEIKLTPGPKVSLPARLRLQKRDKTITAMYGVNKDWVTLASETIKLPAEKTWRDGEGELQLLRASCGVFASSRGANTLASARIVPVAIFMQGLLGEYFADQDFNKLRMARLDPQIRFNWNLGSPDSSLDKDNFSVRWTGKLVAPKTGSYRFYFDADDRARLWIGETEMAPVSLKKNDKQPAPALVPLMAGAHTSLRMEFEDGAGPASVRLGWALPGQTQEVISMTNFLYLFTATNSPESIALARATNNNPSVRGVMLRNGTFVAGAVTKADSSAVRLSFADRKDVAVLSSKVARIFLKPPRFPLPYEIAQGRSGVFTKSGDFFESEFHSIEHGALNMSSVLFGQKRFWLEGGDSLVVVLNDCTPADSGFEVRLLDGSVVRSPRLTASGETLTIDEPVLGRLSVPTTELFEIRALGSRAAAANAKP